MPEEGISYVPKKELLTFEEIKRVVALLASLGVTKVRLTGGEPFVRNGFIDLVRSITAIEGVRELHITTNGTLTSPYIAELKRLNITSVNLSLDTLDRERFKQLTRRDGLDAALNTLRQLREHDIPVKINTVVMEGKNIEDILPMAALTKDHDMAVRFIEEMPFNGAGSRYASLTWSYRKILEHLQTHFGDLRKIPGPPHSTAYHYRIPGHRGTIGIIAAFSRTFCGSCNRIRITARGILKTCLYDGGVLDLRQLLRQGYPDEVIKEHLVTAFHNRAANGFEAEQRRNGRPVFESMSTIGG